MSGADGRARDASVLLPLAGVVLLMPPVVTLFAAPGAEVAGVPLIVVYVFATWLGLIAAAALLARRLG